MPVSYHIRAALPCDAAQIAQLEKLCFSEPWSERQLLETMEDPKGVLYVAVQDDDGQVQVLGYAGLHDIVGEGYVNNIAVFPQFRGQGIGEALTRALIEYMRCAALEFLTLEVRASNLPAISLYEKLGFRQEGRRKNFYRHPTEDARIMTLRPGLEG